MPGCAMPGAHQCPNQTWIMWSLRISSYIKGRQGSLEGSVITQYTFALTVLMLFFFSYLYIHPEFPKTKLIAI